jgi:hypothetical protein
VFESLILKPYRRDKPAQRFQHNGFGATVALMQTILEEFAFSFFQEAKILFLYKFILTSL